MALTAADSGSGPEPGRTSARRLRRATAALKVVRGRAQPYLVAATETRSHLLENRQGTVADPLHRHEGARHRGVAAFRIVGEHATTHATRHESTMNIAARRALHMLRELLAAPVVAGGVRSLAQRTGHFAISGLDTPGPRSSSAAFGMRA